MQKMMSSCQEFSLLTELTSAIVQSLLIFIIILPTAAAAGAKQLSVVYVVNMEKMKWKLCSDRQQIRPGRFFQIEKLTELSI
jgi:hypothetical protein